MVLSEAGRNGVSDRSGTGRRRRLTEHVVDSLVVAPPRIYLMYPYIICKYWLTASDPHSSLYILSERVTPLISA